MEPIINPVWFYLANLAESVKIGCGVVGAVLLVISAVCAVIRAVKSTPEEDEDIMWKWKSEEEKDRHYRFALSTVAFQEKAARVTGCLAAILLLVCIATPSRTAGYQMMAASVVTPNNIQAVTDAGKSVVDYIVESVERMQDEKDSK